MQPIDIDKIFMHIYGNFTENIKAIVVQGHKRATVNTAVKGLDFH